MNRFLPLILVLFLLATGCVTTIQPTTSPPSTSPPGINPTAVQVQSANTPQAPSQATCQSKLLGRVVDAKGALAKGAVIDIKSGSFTAKTLSDDNGLYGFAGLCAGGYGFTVTLSGQSPKALSATATLDGANTVRTDLAVK
jgi:Carboxypeptidase regulatory-like domain